MKKLLVITSLVIAVFVSVSFTKEDLREIYSRSRGQWPRPNVEVGVDWKELGVLPESPLALSMDSLKHVIELGKVLFFDPRLSGSGQISCASCHQPELHWTDGKARSIGHDSAINKRNSPTIQNSWFYKKLFWDGRAKDLEDQVFAPINSESEMHGDMQELPFKLRKIKGYAAMFDSAYGDPGINPDRIAHAIASFEKTIVSSKTRFDEFLGGNKMALSEKELTGLHVFRTKAGCMNCHNGPLFTDNKFHSTHIAFGPRDEGLYNVTHNEEDREKFKTPSLRDVMKTGPWMHDGSISEFGIILSVYQKGLPSNKLGKPFILTSREYEALIAFLKALSTSPKEFKKPTLPE